MPSKCRQEAQSQHADTDLTRRSPGQTVLRSTQPATQFPAPGSAPGCLSTPVKRGVLVTYLSCRTPVLRCEFERRHPEACRGGPSVKALIPDGEDEFGIADGDRAGKMHGVGAAKCVRSGEVACVALNFWPQLDRPDCGPVFLPSPFGCGQVGLVEGAVATGSCKCGTNLGVGEATGQGGVAAIPHVGGQVTIGFFHDQLHQGTRVEVDDGHRTSGAVR